LAPELLCNDTTLKATLTQFFALGQTPQIQPAERDTKRNVKFCGRIRVVLILALDTCDARGSVALLRDELLLHATPHTSSEDYSSWLIPTVAHVLTTAGLTSRDIDLYTVAAGPGSFTGVRVGLTTVKAWSEVYGRPIAAVSRLEAIAAQGAASHPYVAAFIDARRNQIFAALYRRQGVVLERVDEEMVIASDKFLEWCAANVASQRTDWVSTDPHCVTQSPQWSSRLALGETVQAVPPLLAPTIGHLGYRLARQNRLTDALSLDANYVRRSDAELFWKGPPHYGA
jgi:tRNA threonylcarbamoyladenosine biosynthesis protein TsaB